MVIIFLVLIIAWGFARFSILYPANEASFRNGISTENFLEKMFVVPSFGIFGELFMGSPHENLSKYKKTLCDEESNTLKMFALIGIGHSTGELIVSFFSEALDSSIGYLLRI